jgi:hypothetical protein
MKVVLIVLLLFSFGIYIGQNTIKVRKSDTTFNAFYYSKNVSSNTYSNIFQGGSRGAVRFSKKCRSYYILREDGAVFFFNEQANYKKVKRLSDKVDWSILNNTNGRYYISGNEILIIPYTYTETGEKVLGSQSLEGKYEKEQLIMNAKAIPRVMIKYD